MRCRGYRGVLTAVVPGRLKGHDWGMLVGVTLLLLLLWTLR